MSLTPEQLEVRKRSLGSTDSAAVLGLYHPEMAHLSKMKNATDVWLRLVHNIDLPRNDAMGRGIRVEPLLRDLYRQTVGPVADPPGTLRHTRPGGGNTRLLPRFLRPHAERQRGGRDPGRAALRV